jgi:hypothetical protein
LRFNGDRRGAFLAVLILDWLVLAGPPNMVLVFYRFALTGCHRSISFSGRPDVAKPRSHLHVAAPVLLRLAMPINHPFALKIVSN